MSQVPSVVTLVIDHLPASLLGPYGNTMIETVSFNRLASESLLFDFAFADSLDLRTTYRRLWSGIESDAEWILITDDSEVASLGQANFDRIVLIEQPVTGQMAASPATTQLANFFAQASAWIAEELEAGQFCWIHSRGLAGDWDAPYETRQKFAGEEDPLPPRFVSSPHRHLDIRQLDPDELLGYQQAAAAQVVVLDDCLGVLLDQLNEIENDIPHLFVCTSLRGCGLGEHGLVGVEHQLHSEAVHVPMMIRFPGRIQISEDRIGRSSSLTSLKVLAPILQAWLNENAMELSQIMKQVDQIHPDKQAEIITIINEEFEMIQTHAWKLIRQQNGTIRLYAKPDDRWEINDVSDRCPLIVEKLVDLLDRRIGLDANRSQVVRLEDELVLRKD
jgi:arylsulfatase A-like enzyme